MAIREWIQKGSISDELAEQRGLVELVRCKDCIYHENQGTSFGWVPCMEILTGDNWFCGSGKRKEK